MIRSFIIALGFLTIIPTPTINNWQKDDFKKSVIAYPLVGLTIAFVLFVVAVLLQGYQPLLKNSLLISLWFILTGALHFDGFSDIADAVFATKASAERQIIARDPRVGSFALLSGILLVLLKFAALSSVDISYLLIVPVISRTYLVLIMPRFELQDSSKMAKGIIISSQRSLLIFVYGIVICLIIARYMQILLSTFLALLFELLFVFLLSAWISKRMQGLNGDAYGAIIELSELSFLLFIAFLGN